VDQREHPRGGMLDQCRPGDRGHGGCGRMARWARTQRIRQRPRRVARSRSTSARHANHLCDRYEAGLALQGWELKAIRAGRANIIEAYAVVRGGELFLFGAQVTPLIQASSHVVADERRTRKLLLHRHEIDKLVGLVQRDGFTIVPTALYWKANKVKIEL